MVPTPRGMRSPNQAQPRAAGRRPGPSRARRAARRSAARRGAPRRARRARRGGRLIGAARGCLFVLACWSVDSVGASCGSVAFSERQITNSAGDVYSVYAIDVDGDGDVDVLSANFAEVAWYENGAAGSTSSPTWAPSTYYSDDTTDDDRYGYYYGGGGKRRLEDEDEVFFARRDITTTVDGGVSVFAIDVDGDGDVDVLSGSYNDDTVAWYENDSSQSFTDHQITESANSVMSVFAIDVDGDGNVDALSASEFDDTVAWYENDGSLSFTERVITYSAEGALSVFAIDVDGDGDIDVLSADAGYDTVAWYENDGSQSFKDNWIITTLADSARSVFAIDVDGDGDMDALSASLGNNAVAWYENDGSQSFTGRVISNWVNGADSIFAIDVNGDGDADVLSASESDDTVAWYENDGAETFAERNITNSAEGAYSVFAIDVDGDGDVDALSASINDDTVAWYENDCGTHAPTPRPTVFCASVAFSERVITNSADGAHAIFAIDLDSDGDVDVLSASMGDDTVAWHENDGLQSFTERVVTNAADGAHSVYTLDVDGDGDTDVLSASIYDDTIAWHVNEGSLGFTERMITDSADGAASVFAIDVDGDGDTDVLSAAHYDDTVAWYENDGSQSFAERVLTATADFGYSVYAIDVDDDGDLDVLSASKSDDTIALYENNGSQSFTERVVTTLADGAASVFAMDVDGDSDIDVLSASMNDHTVAWYENDGSQSFAECDITTSANGARSVYGTDVDGDSDVDALSAFGSKVAWYENDSSLSFTEHIIGESKEWTTGVFAIDVDGDGDVDALSVSWNDDIVAWYENDCELAATPRPTVSCASVSFSSFTERIITTLADYAFAVFAVDVDGDGNVDALSASAVDDTVAWYENDGSQSFAERVITTLADSARSVFAIDVDGDGDSFTERIITTLADSATSVFAIDVDGDGDVDALSASSRDDTIAWYENDGSESFSERVITTLIDRPYSLFAIDVDGDGDVDALSASYDDDTVAWYENDGSQSFAERVITTLADGAYSVFAIDVDGDGDVDALSASWNDDTVAWYENDCGTHAPSAAPSASSAPTTRPTAAPVLPPSAAPTLGPSAAPSLPPTTMPGEPRSSTALVSCDSDGCRTGATFPQLSCATSATLKLEMLGNFQIYDEYVDVYANGTFLDICGNGHYNFFNSCTDWQSCFYDMDVLSYVHAGELFVEFDATHVVQGAFCDNGTQARFTLMYDGCPDDTDATPTVYDDTPSSTALVSCDSDGCRNGATFPQLSCATSATLKVELLGDFDWDNEYVDVYANGTLLDRCGNGHYNMLSSCEDWQFCSYDMDVLSYVQAGELFVEFDASPFVQGTFCDNGTQARFTLMYDGCPDDTDATPTVYDDTPSSTALVSCDSDGCRNGATFPQLSCATSATLKVDVLGDFENTAEYVDVYANGTLLDSCGNGAYAMLSSCEDWQFCFYDMDVLSYVQAGELFVEFDATSYVQGTFCDNGTQARFTLMYDGCPDDTDATPTVYDDTPSSTALVSCDSDGCRNGATCGNGAYAMLSSCEDWQFCFYDMDVLSYVHAGELFVEFDATSYVQGTFCDNGTQARFTLMYDGCPDDTDATPTVYDDTPSSTALVSCDSDGCRNGATFPQLSCATSATLKVDMLGDFADWKQAVSVYANGDLLDTCGNGHYAMIGSCAHWQFCFYDMDVLSYVQAGELFVEFDATSYVQGTFCDNGTQARFTLMYDGCPDDTDATPTVYDDTPSSTALVSCDSDGCRNGATFPQLSCATSATLKVDVLGDFENTAEYVDVYANGTLLDSCGNGAYAMLSSCEDWQFCFYDMDVLSYVQAGELFVEFDADSSVQGTFCDNGTQVRFTLMYDGCPDDTDATPTIYDDTPSSTALVSCDSDGCRNGATFPQLSCATSATLKVDMLGDFADWKQAVSVYANGDLLDTCGNGHYAMIGSCAHWQFCFYDMDVLSYVQAGELFVEFDATSYVQGTFCDNGTQARFTLMYDGATPSSPPTASFLRITSIGAGATCVSGVECEVLWVYRGDPGACATVDVEVSDSDGTVVRAETATNDGQQAQTVAGDAEVSTYILTLACSDDPTLADSAEFEVSASWHKKNTPSKDCPWVAVLPSTRCAVVGADDSLAFDACFDACGCSSVPTASPTGSPASPAPTLAPEVTGEFTVSGMSEALVESSEDVFSASLANILGVDEEDIEVSFGEGASGETVVEYTIAAASPEDASSLVETISTDLTEDALESELAAEAEEQGSTAFETVDVAEITDAVTDVDCGGGVCPACGFGATCEETSDCRGGICNANVCDPRPSALPTAPPTARALDAPSTGPTTAPSTGPTTAPSTGPTTAPSTRPTTAPSTRPTTAPVAYDFARVVTALVLDGVDADAFNGDAGAIEVFKVSISNTLTDVPEESISGVAASDYENRRLVAIEGRRRLSDATEISFELEVAGDGSSTVSELNSAVEDGSYATALAAAIESGSGSALESATVNTEASLLTTASSTVTLGAYTSSPTATLSPPTPRPTPSPTPPPTPTPTPPPTPAPTDSPSTSSPTRTPTSTLATRRPSTAAPSDPPTPRPTVPSTCLVPHPAYVGDGACDPGAYNSEACGYDGGDCCESTCADAPSRVRTNGLRVPRSGGRRVRPDDPFADASAERETDARAEPAAGKPDRVSHDRGARARAE
ncbi:hypothetical protein JL720_301 [Aureococcus anophagefferens]|nr:hypothetical protein JL720_301 [Aureococcus anophagefferens]